ncbi:unnamed protein product [Ceutorhynchus assimilis]|uniref:Uncharacterized protein n=1 Tax=Ceutorhynchus assimilis TaxID=467358 RepID=A0A9N9MVU8_9CUCU|nr:unnamed protein product [Ceutorhynchus assimilis]
MDMLVDYGSIKIYALATLQKTKQTWIGEDDFTMLQPVLNIWMSEPCEIAFRIVFSNPLNIQFTNYVKSPDSQKPKTVEHENIVVKRLYNAFIWKHNAAQNNPRDNSVQERYGAIKRKARHQIRQIKNKWSTDKAKEIQRFADQHDQKQFFEAIAHKECLRYQVAKSIPNQKQTRQLIERSKPNKR